MKPAKELKNDSAIQANRTVNITRMPSSSKVRPVTFSTPTICQVAAAVMAIAGRITSARRVATPVGLLMGMVGRVGRRRRSCTGISSLASGGSA